MSENGNYIVSNYEGKPDMWSVKPPLLTWIQIPLIKLLGFNELSIRLPSALAALFSCILIFYFLNNQFSEYSFGFIAALVLVTMRSFVNIHTSRTGDIDSLLTFFLLASAISFYHLIDNPQSRKNSILFFVILSFAVLTKGVAGLFFVPAFFFYALIRKKLKLIFSNPSFYIGIGVFIIFVGGFYFLRELNNPGYLTAVWENELFGRYLKTLEKHNQPFFFYFEHITDVNYPFWLYLFPIGLASGFLSKDIKLKQITIFFSLIIFSYFFIISSSQTKLAWYELPIIPFLAIISSIPLYLTFKYLYENELYKKYFRVNFLPIAFLFIVMINPYLMAYQFAANKEEVDVHMNKSYYSVSYYLQKSLRNNQDIDVLKISTKGYYAHILNYKYMAQSRGQQIQFIRPFELKVGDRVLLSEKSLYHEVDSLFEFQVIDSLYDAKVLEILNEKYH